MYVAYVEHGNLHASACCSAHVLAVLEQDKGVRAALGERPWKILKAYEMNLDVPRDCQSHDLLAQKVSCELVIDNNQMARACVGHPALNDLAVNKPVVHTKPQGGYLPLSGLLGVLSAGRFFSMAPGTTMPLMPASQAVFASSARGVVLEVKTLSTMGRFTPVTTSTL